MIDITEAQAKFLLAINDEKKDIVDRDAVKKSTGIPRTTIYHIFVKLKEIGLVETVKVPLKDKGRANIFYRLTKDGKDLVDILLYNKPDIMIRDKVAWSSSYLSKLIEEKKK